MSPSDQIEVSKLPNAGEPSGDVRRLGSIIGFIMFLVLDLMALDDITTDGAWMPEIMIILCSIPALVTLGWFALRKPRSYPQLEGDSVDGTGSHPALPDPGDPAPLH